MKVVIINDYFELGGAEVQTQREYQVLKKNGIDVYSICFIDSRNNDDDHQYTINIGNGRKLLRYYFFDPFLFIRIRRLLKKLRPDIVRANNLNISPITQYLALAGYKVIQTARDYSYVCPKGTCIKHGNPCRGAFFNNCVLECGKESTKVVFYYYRFFVLLFLRKNLVRLFLAPSKNLVDICTLHGYKIQLLRNPIVINHNITKIAEKRSDFFLYYGNISTEKGIDCLLRAFKLFQRMYLDSRKLIIVGKVFEKELFYYEISESIEYLGYLQNDKMVELVKSAYCVIVPSRWMENYPNTVLEPIIYKTLVIGSERGGIPELIEDKKLIFDPNNIDDIVSKMHYVSTLSTVEYKNITETAYSRIKESSNIDTYFDNLTAIISSELLR
jgi:glycosyltransferase involved in cell wall biosynthesis